MFLTERTEFTERKQKEQRVGFVFFRFLKKIKPTSFSVPSVSSSEPCERVRDTSGFSLLEVLVSMTVMVVIIVMVANMYRNASDAWEIGTQRAEMNTSARAAIEYISRELSCAVAGAFSDAVGNPQTIKSFTLVDGNKLRFTALTGDNGTLRGSLFEYDNAMRIIQTDHNNASPYSSSPSAWGGAADKLLITNVWSFGVTVCSNENDMMNGGVGYAYDSSAPANSNLLPACVDISIEMLSERDMARALSPGLPDQAGFVMTNSRVYTTRVCFPNRGGNR